MELIDDEMINKIIKDSMIRLVEEHKDKCNGHCNISLILIAEFLEKSGIELTDEERKIFV